MARLARFIAAIDQGTTSTRCMLFNHLGHAQTSHQVEFSHVAGLPNGWVEHDPMVLLRTTTECIAEMAKKAQHKGIDVSQIEALGITNQRETTVVWDRTTGQPLHNAIGTFSAMKPAYSALTHGWSWVWCGLVVVPVAIGAVWLDVRTAGIVQSLATTHGGMDAFRCVRVRACGARQWANH